MPSKRVQCFDLYNQWDDVFIVEKWEDTSWSSSVGEALENDEARFSYFLEGDGRQLVKLSEDHFLIDGEGITLWSTRRRNYR